MNQEIQKKVIEIRIMEEQLRQLEEQSELINREILYMQTTQANLDEIKKLRQKDIIVPLGKNIFIESKIDSGNRILVDIGSKIVVKKDADGAKEIIEKQKEKFMEAREHIGREVEKILASMDRLDKEIASMQE